MTDVTRQKHYTKFDIEPIEYLNSLLNDEELIGHYWATALVYLSRFKEKNGREDLDKATVYIKLLDDVLFWQSMGIKRPKGNPIYRLFPEDKPTITDTTSDKIVSGTSSYGGVSWTVKYNPITEQYDLIEKDNNGGVIDKDG